jgi:hypothetical protein
MAKTDTAAEPSAIAAAMLAMTSAVIIVGRFMMT